MLVVGSGLAGLRCARVLHEAGHDVIVLEAADAVGGRIRTDRVDGYLVDRGFQLLNPAYPAVRRWIDVQALGLQGFGAGVAAVAETGTVVLGHPLRAPGLLPQTGRTAMGHPREVASVLRWAAPLLRPRARTSLSHVLTRRADVDRAAALDRAGLDGLLRRVVDQFFAGVLLEDDGSTADRYALLLAWMFARGVPSLPAAGMQALPEQVAAPLGDRVRLGHPVDRVEATSVVAAGRAWTARHVVVATGGSQARALTGVDVPAGKGVVTAWWAAPHAPTSDLLHVDALPAQPVPYSAERPARVGDLFVCGDHRDTGSIQGALVSGQRAATAVLAALR